MTKFIVCIGTWANDEKKKNQLKSNIKEISAGGFQYGLATHLNDYKSEDFPEAKFFVFDSHNKFSSLDSPLFDLGFQRIPPQSYSSYYDCDNFRFRTRRGSGSHTFPILRTIYSCCNYAEFLGYDYTIYLEEDVIWDSKVSEKVYEIAERVKFESADFYFTESRNLPGTINPCFFVVKNSFILQTLTPEKLRDLTAFHVNFPNKITEDVLLDLTSRSTRYIIEPQEKMSEIFGEYGVGWDNSQVGKDLERKATAESIKAFTVNHLFLQKQGVSFNLGFLQTIHHLSEELDFFASLDLVESGKEPERIFVVTNRLSPYTYFYWPDFFKIEPKIGSYLKINTITFNSEVRVEEIYRLKLEERELLNYSALYEYHKKV